MDFQNENDDCIKSKGHEEEDETLTTFDDFFYAESPFLYLSTW